MNKLFRLLMKGVEIPDSFSWYAKNIDSEPLVLTDRMTNIINILTTGVPDNRLAMYAAVVCNLAMRTQYGEEIKALDPNNTYVPVTRYPDATHSDADYCMNDLIQPMAAYKKLSQYLSDDIIERLDTYSWFDMMGAGCLQLLREDY